MTAPNSATITKASKSNLALAFVSLPPERRTAITSFYAFCRLADDIADDPGIPPAERLQKLALWRDSLDGPVEGESEISAEIRETIAKYRINVLHFREIIEGVAMDIEPRRYQTFDDLRRYCYLVASAVGLVSIEIFGYRNPACKEYAVALGLALQLTNILRDVREDWENGGRIYLPMEDLARFQYPPEDLAARVYDERFLRLMRFQADRAAGYYQQAAALLPREDRRSMTPARIMAAVYGSILRKMRGDGFRVYEKRYRLSSFQKAAIVGRMSLPSILLRRMAAS